MKTLKAKFGKFAVSNKAASKINGGTTDMMDPSEDTDYPGGDTWQCRGTDARYPGYVFDLGNPYSDPNTAANFCGSDPRCVGCFQ